MKKLNHILCGIAMLTTWTCAAGNSPAKANKAFQNQGDILSKDLIIDRTQMKNFHRSSADIKDPKEREKMRLQMRNSGSKVATKINAPKMESEKLYTVTCVFEGDFECPYFAIYNPDFFLESSYGVWEESGETDTYYFQVPAGTYDVFTQYYSYIDGWDGWGNLVHEDIEVTDDIEVRFSPEELTEKVVIKPMLRDGKEAVLPLYIELEEEPWYEIDNINATADFSYLTYVLFREGCDILVTGYAVSDAIIPGWNEETTFLSNKLSDKYHYIFQYFLEDMNGEIQITTTDMMGAESGVIYNYTENFVKYPVPTFTKTPLYEECGIERFNISLSGLLWIDDVQQGGGGMYLSSETPNVYYAVQPVNDNINLKAPIRPTSVQAEKTVTLDKSTYTSRVEMPGLPALYNGSEWEYINQNHSECGNLSYQRPEEGPIVEYPGVPSYSYFSNQMNQPIGNSSPVLVTMTQVNEYPEATIFLISPQAYIGRYGEVRNCDQWNLHTLVTLNGEIAFDSTSGGYLEDWCIENSLDGHEKGIIEATFTNRNVLVDETIPGFNITTMKVDERNEDVCTPTTQMLIFKNTDGEITDRFKKGKEGIIEFSAGDFNWHATETNWYYSCEEADVKVEYAAYGEENFMPLDIEEIPENYFMPGFGYFYRGSLADVTMPTSNGWYDLRFTLTDKAGNEMTQRISPAFKIDTNVSVNAVTIDGIKVWSANGVIFANGTDIASMALYSTEGKLIATSNSSSLSTNGYRGIGIVKVTDHLGKVSTHKTTLR